MNIPIPKYQIGDTVYTVGLESGYHTCPACKYNVYDNTQTVVVNSSRIIGIDIHIGLTNEDCCMEYYMDNRAGCALESTLYSTQQAAQEAGEEGLKQEQEEQTDDL